MVKIKRMENALKGAVRAWGNVLRPLKESCETVSGVVDTAEGGPGSS